MTNKLVLNKPALILLYGYPGAGKTFFARQLCEDLHAAHVQGERIRTELFENPRYDKEEDQVVSHLMDYMAEEFLGAGVSVVYDMNASRINQRRLLRELARRAKAHPILIWLQVDTESAYARVAKRDRRKADDKYTPSIDRTTFETLAGQMQNPQPTEEFMVISGKHTYQTQRSAAIKKLYDFGLIHPDEARTKFVKPNLVNMVPNARGRVDQSRRNILIR